MRDTIFIGFQCWILFLYLESCNHKILMRSPGCMTCCLPRNSSDCEWSSQHDRVTMSSYSLHAVVLIVSQISRIGDLFRSHSWGCFFSKNDEHHIRMLVSSALKRSCKEAQKHPSPVGKRVYPQSGGIVVWKLRDLLFLL